MQLFLGDFIKARRFKATRDSFIQKDFSDFATLMDGLFVRLGNLRVAKGKPATPQAVRDLRRLMSFDNIAVRNTQLSSIRTGPDESVGQEICTIFA